MSVNDNTEKIPVLTGVTEDKYEYLWKIQNFSKMEKKGIQLESQHFEIFTKNSSLQSKWIVGLENKGESFRIYSKLLDILSEKNYTELSAIFAVTMRWSDDSVEWCPELQKTLKINEKFDLPTSSWWNGSTEWPRFLDSNGALTLKITLSILEPFSGRSKKVIEKLEQEFQAKSVSIVKRNMEILLVADSTEYDVKIICSDGKEFKCHKSILKANSSVFKSMLQSGLSEETTGVVNVSDLSGKTMEVLLQYLYTGDLASTWCQPDIIVELMYAAGKYELSDLLNYLDNMLGNPNYEGSFPLATLFALLDLANKLALKSAEAQLENWIVELTLSAKKGGGGGVLDLFRGVI